MTIALSWAGWRLLSQQRDIDQQREQERLGSTAESIAAAMRGELAETGERLSLATAIPAAPLPVIPNAAVMTSRPDGTVIDATGLPFVPAVAETAATDAIFAEAEALEVARADLAGAASGYQALTAHADPTVRAGALLRLARVSEKRGDVVTALRSYQQVEHTSGVRYYHLPAGFVALYQQHAIAAARGDVERQRQLADVLTTGLNAGDWLLTRIDAAHYRAELGITAVPASWQLAEAVERIWHESGTALTPRGQRVFNDGPRGILVMWRRSAAVTAVMAAFLDAFLPAAPADTAWHLADPGGRWIAGSPVVPANAAAPRVVGDSEYAWVLHVGSAGLARTTKTGEGTLIAMVAAMLVFLWGAMYFMARALRREAAVARLQSDFVAAVSHEFRSPLTTIRQMAEMLEADRVPSSQRRQAYYRVLAGEASRLQRLVETLLNFGRMEAGAARYTLTEVDLAEIVRRVVDDIEPAGVQGNRVAVTGSGNGPLVNADASALAVAIRNVIDNALKYSPDGSAVRVDWDQDDSRAHVRVTDAGIGIPRSEQHAIFDKFVRGRAAIDGNVAGTGVGLAMVRQILRAHGGDIAVESEVGQGCTFTLTVPLANAERADLKVGPYADSDNADPRRGRPSGRPDAEDAVVHS